MELRDYVNVIRARKWTIVQATIVVAVTALVVSLLQPQVYESEAKVLISERDSAAALLGNVLPELSSQPERGMQTQVQLIQLRPFAEETIRALGLEVSPSELLADLNVESIGQTNILVVQARADDPETAAEIANTIALEYVRWSRETQRESISTAAEEVEARLDVAREEILELGRRIEAEGQSDELSAELQIATGSYTTLAEQLEQLKISEELESGSGLVVSPAVPSAAPVEPTVMRNTLLGLVVGVALGLAMAFLNNYLDNTIKSGEEVESIYDAPILGTIPAAKQEKTEERRLLIVQNPGSPAAESYRVLRNSLDFVNFEHDMKTVLVTSAAPGEGKSTVAANLAQAIAQAGSRVVLVSTDFRRPTTQQFFSVSNVIGLSDVLLGSHSLKGALQRPGDESLLILTSGKMPPNPAELLSSARMQTLVEELGEWADWVIIDSSPVLAVADPASVARWADGVLVVTKAGESTRDAARKTGEILTKVGARIIGVVVWGLKASESAAGYGYYPGGYASYFVESEEPGGSGQARGVEPVWATEVSPGRRIAGFIGRVLTAALAFLVVIVVALVVVYFLDVYFEWGVTAEFLGLLM
jgi:non-specific protein-tyrosine kinase